MSVSLDGFVGDVNGKNDWIFRSSDEKSRAWLVDHLWEAGVFIMGRKSFEEMSPFWPTAPGPMAAPMNEIPKAVFSQKGFEVSSSLPSSWSQSRVFNGDLSDGIKQLKSEEGKPIVALGGAEFMRSLIATGLVDEYNLVTHPVVLGNGLPIFTGIDKPLDLKLVDAKSFPGGIVVHTYHPA